MKYTAITIGPIIKTLELAHKTRELWVASYFFSGLMEKIIEKLKKNDKIIIPYPNKNTLIENLEIEKRSIKSAGIYPDRLILEGAWFDELQNAVNIAITDIHKQYGFNCSVDDLENYLSTYIIEFEYEGKGGNNENIIFRTNSLLAIAELQAKYEPQDKACFLKMFENFYQSKFYTDLFNKNLYNSTGFPSILEITTRGLNTTEIDLNDDEDDNEIWKSIANKNSKFKILHKYIAIVQADGDNIGEVIKKIAENGNIELQEFSKALSTFSLKASAKIAEYEGVPIYTGGDDLLFFAPVSNEKKNIFELIEELDTIFKTEITDKFEDIEPKPSMSYGLSVTYYKFPMHEALKSSQNLLFNEAKKANNKNAVAINIQKHSGQTYKTVISKPFSKEFYKLLKQNQGLVINSVLHNLDEQKVLLSESLSDDSNANLNALFDHFCNENIHKDSKDFIDEIKALIQVIYKKNNKDFDKTFEQISTQLQIVKFLNDTKNE